MSAMTGTVVEVKGRLFVRYEVAGYAEPVMVTNFWPVDERRSNGVRQLVGQRVADSACHGVFSVAYDASLGDRAGEVYRRFSGLYATLTDNQRTECVPEMTECRPIPCPKTRGKPTRWEGTRGRWEKLLKEGWVPA